MLIIFLFVALVSAVFSQENCYDQFACNYNPTGEESNELCCFEGCGCTDPLACNYDDEATCSIAICDYFSCVICEEFTVNNEPSNAIMLSDSVMFFGSLCCSTPSMTNPCFPNDVVYDQWFYFNSDTLDEFIVDFQMADGFLGGGTFYGLNIDSLTLDSTLVPLACSSSVTEFSTTISGFYYWSEVFDYTPFTDYYFSVWTTDPSACGDFELMASGRTYGCTSDTSPNFVWWADLDDGTCLYPNPPGDFCEGAFVLNCGDVFEGTTGLSSSHGTPIGLENCEYRPGNGIWHKFTGTGGDHTLSTCGSFLDTKINLYSQPIGDDCGLAEFSCVEFQSDAGIELCGVEDAESNYIEFTSEVGLEYYVYVGYENVPEGSSGGPYQLELQCLLIVGCTGDFDEDGSIGAADMLTFLSSFGCMETCMYDLNGDGMLNAADLLLFLAVYGQSCN